MRITEKTIEILKSAIRFEAVPEAIKILEKCSDARFNEFITYYDMGKENICCMVLDIAKSELVESNLMNHSKDDWFGSPYLETTLKI